MLAGPQVTLLAVPWNATVPADPAEAPLAAAVEAIIREESPSLARLIVARRRISINHRRLTALINGTRVMGGPRLGGCRYPDGSLLNGTDFMFLTVDSLPRAVCKPTHAPTVTHPALVAPAQTCPYEFLAENPLSLARQVLSADRVSLTLTVSARPGDSLASYMNDTAVDVYRGTIGDFVKQVLQKKDEGDAYAQVSGGLRTVQEHGMSKYDDMSVWGLLVLRTLIRENGAPAPVDPAVPAGTEGTAPPPEPSVEDVWVDATPEEIMHEDGAIDDAEGDSAAVEEGESPATRRRRRLMGGISLDTLNNVAEGLRVLEGLSNPGSALRNLYSEPGMSIICNDCGATTGMGFNFRFNPFSCVGPPSPLLRRHASTNPLGIPRRLIPDSLALPPPKSLQPAARGAGHQHNGIPPQTPIQLLSREDLYRDPLVHD